MPGVTNVIDHLLKSPVSNTILNQSMREIDTIVKRKKSNVQTVIVFTQTNI